MAALPTLRLEAAVASSSHGVARETRTLYLLTLNDEVNPPNPSGGGLDFHRLINGVTRAAGHGGGRAVRNHAETV